MKENPNMKLDMNALGDGYFCDLLCDLSKKDCKLFAEIGRGKSKRNK